ncbi:WhiB family transcriptional regulator [Rhodococcus sp. NPDC003382]
MKATTYEGRAREPAPPADDRNDVAWRREALCRNFLSNLFFGHDDETRGERARRERTALEICARCAVVDRCRQHAVETGEAFGIWGGTTERARQSIRRIRS